GPMAGVLRMPWRSFALFNFLGATLWVTVVSLVGYLFGSEWDDLLRIMKRVNTGLFAAAAVVAVFLYWRYRRRRAARAGTGEDD
ncbi:MAG TPA: DedA family protein, partial [Terriglobales bacterium]|nr:DedA family protein [Terriglobales bacterium]